MAKIGNSLKWAWLLVYSGIAFAQDMNVLKSGVVKITAQEDGRRQTGSGFIIKLEPDEAMIVTASHVIEGASQVQVEFAQRRDRPVAAEVLQLEGGDPKGLALLRVRGKDKLPSGLTALALSPTLPVREGDEVIAIGFGRAQGGWIAVLKPSIMAIDGRNLRLDRKLEGGNSGGPLIKDGKVVGLITESGEYGLATPAPIIHLVLTNWGVDVAPALSQPSAASAPNAPPSGNTANAPTGAAPNVPPATLMPPAVPKTGDPAPAVNEQRQVAPNQQDPAEASAGTLTWQDHAIRYVGTLQDSNLAGPTLKATLSDLAHGTLIGNYEVPVQLAPVSLSEVLVSANFNVPGDSTTPGAHSHISILRFREAADGSVTLVENCPSPGQCFPAQGTMNDGQTAHMEENYNQLEDLLFK